MQWLNYVFSLPIASPFLSNFLHILEFDYSIYFLSAIMQNTEQFNEEVTIFSSIIGTLDRQR